MGTHGQSRGAEKRGLNGEIRPPVRDDTIASVILLLLRLCTRPEKRSQMKSHLLSWSLGACLLGYQADARSASTPPPTATPTATTPLSQGELNRLIGGPALVTMHLKNASVQTVVAELTKQAQQAGVALRVVIPDNDQDSKITVDLEKQPLWAAIRNIAPKIGVLTPAFTSSPEAQSDAINLEPTGAMDSMTGSAFQSGPCLFIATGIEHGKTITISPGLSAPPKKEESIELGLHIFLDPKLRRRVVPGAGDVQQAMDDKNHALIFDVHHNPFSGAGFSKFYNADFPLTPLGASITLHPVPGLGKRVPKLSGRVRFQVMTRSQTWEIPDILKAKNAVKTVALPGGEERYEIVDVQKSGNKYLVNLKISRPQHRTLEVSSLGETIPRWLWTDDVDIDILAPLRLLDANGHEVGGLIFDGSGDENQVMATATFAPDKNPPVKAGAPAKLVWTLPVEFRPLVVPFEFDNVPLP